MYSSSLCIKLLYPPTEKLKPIDGTVLLCCQDSNDPTQEATGKTITGHGSLSAPNINLVPNGDFTNGTTSWTAGGSNNQSVTGTTMRVSNNSSTNGRSTGSAFDTDKGGSYRIRYSAVNSSSATFRLEIREANGAGSEQAFEATSAGPKEYYFTATESQHSVVIYAIGSGTSWAEYANIRVEVITNYANAPKVLPSVGVDEGVTFSGDTKVNTQQYMYFPTGDTTQRSRGRAVIFGGVTTTPSYLSSISYYNISNFSSAHDFGDMRAAGGWMTACSSSTRGLAIGAGNGGGATNVVDYVEIATTGNGKDFGDLTEEKNYYGAASNQTRALRAGGYGTGSDVIDYGNIASTGDFVDFGNLTQGRLTHEGGLSSPTRAVWGGGTFYSPTVVYHNIIDYVTIATTGNATDFGDMSVNRKAMAAVSSSTRGIWSGAYKSGTSNGTRGVWSGGRSPGGNANRTNLIEHVTIATTGDGTDFGDLDVRRDGPGACSDSHGGLS